MIWGWRRGAAGVTGPRVITGRGRAGHCLQRLLLLLLHLFFFLHSLEGKEEEELEEKWEKRRKNSSRFMGTDLF